MIRDASLIPLSHDHHRALALCVLVQRSLAEDEGPENVSEQGRRIVEQFESEIREHFQMEEQVLFPELEDYPGAAVLIDELLAEHVEIAALVQQLAEGAGTEVVGKLCQLLPSHIRKEERLLFPQVQELLSREQLDALGKRLVHSGGTCST